MPFILIIVAGLMIMAAWNNSVGNLMTELETDVPGFLKWFLALAVVGGLGYVPGMERFSKMLLGLVMLVLVLSNWTQILAGFQALQQGGAAATPGATNPDPTAAYLANPNNPQITQAEISGTAASSSSAQLVNVNAAAQQPAVTSPYGAFDPNQFVAEFAAGFGGFGGVA